MAKVNEKFVNLIRYKIDTDQRWTERAVLALFEKQTAYEQQVEGSVNQNFKGFNSPDAHRMTYYAKWIKSGKHLNGKHLGIARTKLKKYARQLAVIASEKQAQVG